MRDIDETRHALSSAGYEASEAIATAAYLADGLGKALLIEGLPIEDPVSFSNAICDLMQ